MERTVYFSRHGWLRRALLAVLAGSLLGADSDNCAHAVTVAHWDFEDDLISSPISDGQNVSHTIASGVHQDAVPDVSGNSNHLSGYDSAGGTGTYRSFVSSGNQTGSTFSVQNSGSYPSLSTDGDLKLGGSPVADMGQWTIEASAYFTGLSGFQTMVGKDGVGQAPASSDAAPLYFQKTSSNVFSIKYIDSNGLMHTLDGATPVVTGTWYNVAATSDGSTLRLFVNGYEDASLDLTASGSTNTAMIALDESGVEGSSGPAYGWSLLRGMYNDYHTDRVNGYLDDVRISDTALSPNEFLSSFIDSVTLVVNTVTGQVRLRNDSGAPVSFDYYRIDSPTDGALLTADYDGTDGWHSLGDQGVDAVGDGADPGERWEEVSSAVSAYLLVEQFLLGDTTLEPGEYRWLGAPVNLALLGDDLEFRFAEPGAALQRARVVYTNEVWGLPGDFNNDGIVDTADYTVWRDNLGAADESPLNNNGDGTKVVDERDYALWRAQYGATAPGMALATGAATVPEPAAWCMAACALAFWWRRALSIRPLRKPVCLISSS